MGLDDVNSALQGSTVGVVQYLFVVHGEGKLEN